MAQGGSFRCFVHGCCVQTFSQCSKESRLFQSTRLTKFVKSLREPTDVRVRVSASTVLGTAAACQRDRQARGDPSQERITHITLGMFNVPAMNVSCVSQFLVYEGCAFLTSPFVRFGWCCDHTEFQLRFHSEGGYSFPSPLNVTFCRRRTVLLKGAKVICFSSMAHSSGCFDASG